MIKIFCWPIKFLAISYGRRHDWVWRRSRKVHTTAIKFPNEVVRHMNCAHMEFALNLASMIKNILYWCKIAAFCINIFAIDYCSIHLKGPYSLLCWIISVECQTNFEFGATFFHCGLCLKLDLVCIWFSLICTPIDGAGSQYKKQCHLLI